MGTEDIRFDPPESPPEERNKDEVMLIASELIAFASLVYGARRDYGPFTLVS
jgi:hypothetical protein